MTILINSGSKPYKHPKQYDPNDESIYSWSFRPKSWTTSTEYVEGDMADAVIPTVPNGFYYECVSGGISSGTEPLFSTIKGKTTVDGSVKWKSKPYNLFLKTGDSVTTSTWAGTNGETLDSEVIINGIQTKFKLLTVPTDATSASIINNITVTRSNGDIEKFDFTMIITIKDR